MDSQQSSLEAIQDIKKIMERSSRFLSLSGFSGISAGICALVGAYIANRLINDHSVPIGLPDTDLQDVHVLKWKLLLLAALILAISISFSFYFTWQKAKKKGLPVWDHASRKLLVNLAIPLISGGIFVSGLVFRGEWIFVSPACLIFYGLALVNASKYTLTDIRYLGYLEVILGAINIYLPGYGLYFWAVGFGLLHILYGFIMWRKYDRN